MSGVPKTIPSFRDSLEEFTGINIRLYSWFITGKGYTEKLAKGKGAWNQAGYYKSLHKFESHGLL